MASSNKINALLIADYLILKSQEEGKTITNKKLQKLLYYVQAWSVTLRNKKVFDDKIEAWVHGPAIREVYLEFKKFGADPIKKKITASKFSKINKDTKKLIESVWNAYAKYDAPFLEHLSHSEDPWLKAREGLESNMSSTNEITIASMKAYYKTKINKED